MVKICKNCNKEVSFFDNFNINDDVCDTCSKLLKYDKIELNKINCTDCIIGMKKLPNEYIDLTVTSPPYDNLRDYDSFIFDYKGIIKELYRITKKGGVVVWVVGDATINGNETGTSFKQALYFKEVGFKLHDTMIYEKAGFAHPSVDRYHQIFEYMFVFSKITPKTFNPIIDKKIKWDKAWGKNISRGKDGVLKESPRDPKYSEIGMRNNIWRYAVGKGFTTKDKIAYEHPAIFPEKLAQDNILSWSNEGDLILDPMCGSGTTCKMAKLNNRNFIGFELSEKYYKIAEKRLSMA